MRSRLNYFTEITVYIFKAWSSFFILFFFPLDLMNRSSSFLNYLSYWDILFNSSIMIFALILAASLLAVLSGVVSFILSFIMGDKIKTFILWTANIVMLTIAFYAYGAFLVIWLNRFSEGNYILNPNIITIIVTVVTLTIIIKLKNNFCGKIKDISEKCYKAVKWAAVLSLLVCAVRLMLAVNDGSFKANNKKEAVRSGLPNIIMITFDAFSAEDMSLYGYKNNTTPNIDTFAKNSYVFTNMYSNGNFTPPSVSSILTGKYPITHKLYHIYAPIPYKAGENIVHLLKENGYQTAAVVDNPRAHPWQNMTYKDFDYLPAPAPFIDRSDIALFINTITPYIIPLRSTAYIWIEEVILSAAKKFRSPSEENDTDMQIPNAAGATFEKASDYLETLKSPATPLFLWIHVFPPHSPYMPPKDFKYVFLKEKVLDTPLKQNLYGYEHPNHLRKRYDEHILGADYEFGKFLKLLEGKELYANSIIVLSADHGEMFKRKKVGHRGPFMDQQLIHIPLIIHLPGQKEGKLIKSNAEQIDVAPTILNILSLDVPDWMEGESLEKAMTGNYISAKPKYSMWLEPNSIKGPVKYGTIAVVQNNYKYIYNITKDSGYLYNLSDDPEEKENIYDTEPEKAALLKKLVLERMIYNLPAGSH